MHYDISCKSLKKNEDGKVDYNDLLRFVNIKIDPLPPAEPMNIKVCLLISIYILLIWTNYLYCNKTKVIKKSGKMYKTYIVYCIAFIICRQLFGGHMEKNLITKMK